MTEKTGSAAEVFERAALPEKTDEKTAESTTSSASGGATKAAVRSQGVPMARVGALVIPILVIVVFVAIWLRNPILALILILVLLILPLVYWLAGSLARRSAQRRRQRRQQYGEEGYSRSSRSAGGYSRRSRTGPGGRAGGGRASRVAAQREAAAPGPRRSLRDRLRGRNADGTLRRQTRSSRSEATGGRGSGRGRRNSSSDTVAPAKPSLRDRMRQRRADRRQQSAASGGSQSTKPPRQPKQPKGATEPRSKPSLRDRMRRRRADRRRQNAVSGSPDSSTTSTPRSPRTPKDKKPAKDKLWSPKAEKKPKDKKKTESVDGAADDAAASQSRRSRLRGLAQRLRRTRSGAAATSGESTKDTTKKPAKERSASKRGSLRTRVRNLVARKGTSTPEVPAVAVPSVSTAPARPPHVPFQEPGGTPQLGSRPPIVPVPFSTPASSGSTRGVAAPVASRIRGKMMATSTAVNLTNPYAHMVDPSTPASLAQTLANAASVARVDAAKFDDQATQLRRDAAGLADKAGMAEIHADFLKRAAEAATTAEHRRGLAAGYEKSASEVKG